MNIHQKIEALMTRSGYSQQMLATKVGVSQRSVSDWCKNSVPRQGAVKKLSEVFRIDPDVLLDDKQDLPEWEPPEKVRRLYGDDFFNHLKKTKRETELAVEESPEGYGSADIIQLLLSIDKTLKSVATSLQTMAEYKKPQA